MNTNIEVHVLFRPTGVSEIGDVYWHGGLRDFINIWKGTDHPDHNVLMVTFQAPPKRLIDRIVEDQHDLSNHVDFYMWQVKNNMVDLVQNLLKANITKEVIK